MRQTFFLFIQRVTSTIQTIITLHLFYVIQSSSGSKRHNCSTLDAKPSCFTFLDQQRALYEYISQHRKRSVRAGAPSSSPPRRLIFRSLVLGEKRWRRQGRRWCVFECINQCHSLGRVVFDVKQTLWECRPCCEERLWRADGETASSQGLANYGDTSVSALLCPVKSLSNISSPSVAFIKLFHRCLKTFVNYMVLTRGDQVLGFVWFLIRVRFSSSFK